MDLTSLNLHVQGPDLLLPVLVQPGARRDKIVGVRDGALKLAVSAPPAEGKANAACRRLLADALKVPVSRIAIIAGASARRKRIRIRHGDLAALKMRLASLLK